MEWQELTKFECDELFETIDFNNVELEDKQYRKLRFSLLNKYEDVLEEIDKGIYSGELQLSKKKYYIDCLFGIELYQILKAFKFKNHDANNNDIWRFLSMKVIPDLVHERYGNKAARFYAIPNRIWLKTIWWYVFLSLQVTKNEENKNIIDYDATKKILMCFDTDYIMQIVDRAGSDGYRVKLNRLLVKKLYENISLSNSKNRFYRKIMILNTARLKVIDPNLYDGGINGYVNDLFNYFMKEENN